MRVALVGLGMAVTPHAKSMLDLKDRVEVVHAFSPSAARSSSQARLRAASWSFRARISCSSRRMRVASGSAAWT